MISLEHARHFTQVSLVLAALAGFASCARPDGADVEIVVSGEVTLAVGETVSLAAMTEHGTDHGYTWSSSNEDVARVDDDGLVTGVAIGPVTITATGLDTGEAGELDMLVLDDEEQGGLYYERWRSSPHADASARAFTHWDEDGEIATQCARCHSRGGFQDYIGEDGSGVAVVDQPAAIGTTVDCETCHNDAASELDWVEFPSGATLADLGPEARCITCHQGRASGDDIEGQIQALALADDDVSSELTFNNIHYRPAGATLYAGIARGGYQYADQLYDRRLRHVPTHQTCVDCHDAHSTQVKWSECAECHPAVSDGVSARDIRMIASYNVDYDGDNDTSEGIYHELAGLHEKLYQAIQTYAVEALDQPICYSPARPYWYNKSSPSFADCTEAEAVSDNAFTDWTPRLLRAAYNYHSTRQDPGAFAHNARYIVKLLHDSTQDLNSQLSEPVDMSLADRDAPGHFNAASEAARHWDEDEAVSASCSACHSGAEGFRFYVEFGVGVEVAETANGMECYTCHETFGDSYDLLEVATARYPSGIQIDHAGNDNLCANCHAGRTSKATIDAAIASDNLRFLNVHYLPAAAVRNGSESHVGYEYDAKTYAGYLVHDERTQCTGCHDPVASSHTFLIEDAFEETCSTCHNDSSSAVEIRNVHLDDYDGDGNTSETLAAELDGLEARVVASMSALDSICYDAHTYPYWFTDNAGTGGACAPEDATYANAFAAWTPALMKAAHNYQLSAKDPGGYAHNFDYLAQLLIDSIEDLGGDVNGLVRP